MLLQTALPVAKLRSLRHYKLEEAKEQPFANRLADALERCDTVITPHEFKSKLEEVLRAQDTEDYDRGSNGTLIPIYRLFVLKVLLADIVPRDFLSEVDSLYPQPA